ncbi:unnamed protein product [Didymodactylos carnosus]|uniref:Uncharacterized protein n=1 Tax=Didymodactylos carnosus TaxID=1234261 RepID=A0A814TW93_9BILA|nr:unnamed protein product [Didymodactylos carnosus]CAF1166791.1 unnamed protein product [Didymodactylos carnosus]CAF3518142.1 unnamed protein product [Didymodactylos carnosus]CAF3930383.1 unnamed protein product [Didymodactylos carnosus]
MLKVCYMNVFENHLHSLTTLLNEHGESLEIYQTHVGSVGSWAWEAGIALCFYLYDHMFHEMKDRHIIEIGAGTGLVGLQVCALGAHTTLTDREEYVDLMNYNINKNRHLLTGTVEAQMLFWGDARLNEKEYDYIIAANCVYHSIDLDSLIQTICQLTTTNKTQLICCYELRNDGIRQLVNEFHEKLKQDKFHIEYVEHEMLRKDYQNDYNCIVKCKRL